MILSIWNSIFKKELTMADVARVHACLEGLYPDIVTCVDDIQPELVFCAYGPLMMGAGEVLVADVIRILSGPTVARKDRLNYKIEKLFDRRTGEPYSSPMPGSIQIITVAYRPIMPQSPLYASTFLLPYTGEYPKTINALDLTC